MNRYFLITGLLLVTTLVHAQQSHEVVIADKIAQKMKDSLSLSQEQKADVYAVNLQLHAKKMQLRTQAMPMDSLSKKIQRVENTRDSLYRLILTSPQFQRYQEKKRDLVNNN